MISILWQVMMGVGLAASAGLRAFLPLLLVGLAGRAELVPLGEHFAWLAGTPALTVLTVAVLLEVLGDKIPLLDNALDAAGTVVRPVAGAIAAAAPITTLDPLTAAVVGLVIGTSVAGGVHLAKASLRLGSTAATAGIVNPALSVGEDVASFTGALIAIFVPVMAFALALAILAAGYRLGRRTASRD